MKKRLIISTAAFFLVCSCDDPNEPGLEKIDEDKLSITYVNFFDHSVYFRSQTRGVELRSDSKDGYSRTIYVGTMNCVGQNFRYTRSMTIYKNLDGSISTTENSFADDNQQSLRLTLRGDDALHRVVCGGWLGYL